jgi:bacterioferritin-associated ferredoxin
MIVCLCHRVSDRDIHRAAACGIGCFEVLQDETRVASSCGSCLDCARQVFDAATGACGKASHGIRHPAVAAVD